MKDYSVFSDIGFTPAVSRMLSVFIAAGLVLTFGYGVASAQTTVEDTNASSGDSVSASKDDEVEVQTVLRLTVPADRTVTNGNALNHDETNNDQAFTNSQEWDVDTNHLSGATFELTWNEFVNQTDNSYTRPAKIALSEKTDGADWDLSAGANGDTSATSDRNDSGELLDAVSSVPGGATWEADVTFIETGSGIATVDNNIAPSGTYNTTITGTLTAN